MIIGLFSFTGGGFFFEDNLAYGDADTPAITSAVTTNTSTIQVTFNHGLDDDTISTDDFAVSGNTISSATRGSGGDNNIITIVLGTALTNGDDFTLTIPNGKSISNSHTNSKSRDLNGEVNTTVTNNNTFDTTAPTFTADRTGDNTILLTFSENVDVTTTNGAGYTVSGGTVTANTDPAGSSTTMTLTTSGITDTSATPTVTYTQAAGTTLDAASNEVANGGNAVATDSVAPTPTIISSNGSSGDTTNADPINFSISFDESVTGFASGDVTVSGTGSPGSVTSFSGSGSGPYTFTIAPGADGTVIVNVSGSVAIDGAGNNNSAASQFTITSDATGPTSSASYTASAVNNGDAQTITVTFGEAVTGTPTIALSGAKTVSATSMSGSGDTWTYSAGTTWTGDGTVTVTVGTATDATGNTVNSAPSSNTFTIDNTGPTSAASYTANTINDGTSQTVTVTFGEAVTGTPTITLTGSSSGAIATDQNMSGSGNTWTYSAGSSWSTNETVTVTVGTATDATGNTVNSAPSSNTFTVDNISPTAAITYSEAGPYKSDDSITITATFNEVVKDSPVPQISISGPYSVSATNMAKTSTTVYTYSHTVGTGDGTATVSMATAQDVNSNVVNSAPSSGATFEVDNTTPTMDSAATVTTTRIDVTFSEDLDASTIAASDFGIQGSNGVSAVAENSAGVVTLTLNSAIDTGDTPTVTRGTGNCGSNEIEDLAGNALCPRTLESTDGLSPTFTAERTAVDTITLTFSENVDADSANENSAWTVSGGTITATSDPADSDSMTITFSGIADTSATPTVTYVAANGTVDDGTPGNEVTNGESAVATDGVGPTVTITSSSGSSGDTINSSTLSYTVTFSESVSDFVLGDITVSGTANGGTPVASNFAGSGTTYTFDVVKGTSDGTVSVQIAQKVATDSSSNKSTASNTYNLTVDSSLSATPVNRSSGSSKPVNNAPSFSSSISKVDSTSTNGDTGFGGILKSGPATDETTRVIDSGETVRLRINLSDKDGLSEINQVAINTNFKKDSNISSIPYAQVYWTTFNDLKIYDKDGIFSDVKTQTITFDDDLILFVDITFDGFMDTTDLQIKAYDKNMASMIETYEDAWTLNPPIVQTVYEEPVKEFQDLIRISENVIDYNKSGIAGGGHTKPIFISAELGEDSSNKPGMTVIRNSDGTVVQKIHFRANSDGAYSGVIGVTNEWVPDDYSIHVEIGQKNITPVHLSIFSEYDSEMLPVSQTPNSDVEEFVAVSSLHETVTNTQSPHLIEINGLVDTLKSGHPVNVKISGNGIEDKFTSMLSSSGEFNSYFEIDSKWNSGDYDISVDYLGDVIFTDVMTVDNQMISENPVLVGMVEPESSLNFDDSFVYQRIDFTESIVMLLASNANEFEISDSPELSNEFEPATDFIMEGTINTSESRLTPVVEIRNEQEVVQTLNILTNKDGEFSVPVDILEAWVDGSYTATIMSGEFEISSTTFVVKQKNDVEPEILEKMPDQIIGEVFISDKDVTPGYFPAVLTVSGNVISYTGELIDVDISKDSQSIKSLRVIGTNVGFFSVPVHIGNDMESGQYTISVNYLDESVGTSQFTIHEN